MYLSITSTFHQNESEQNERSKIERRNIIIILKITKRKQKRSTLTTISYSLFTPTINSINKEKDTHIYYINMYFYDQ